MRVDLAPADTLKALKAMVSEQLKKRTGQATEFRIQPSLSFALNEVTRGLARLFPHRRSIAYIQGCGPYFEPLMTYFSVEGYSLQALPFSSLTSVDWIENLKKDTLFVLASSDDPLTGQIFEIEGIQKSLELKKIFTISASHASHLYKPVWSVSPYHIACLSGGDKFTLSVLGARASKIESLLFGPADWATHMQSQLDSFFELKTEDAALVSTFESLNWGQSQPFFRPGIQRIFDRAALCWTDMDGEALIHEMALSLRLPLHVPGQGSQLETASLCRWKGLQTLNWLAEQGVSPETSRGLVLISKDLISDKLGSLIEKSRKEILRLQGTSPT